MSIQSELMAIKGSNEFLIVEEVVKWAREHPGSDLYKAIEWDDQKAAEEHRYWQVRRLIALHVTYEGGGRKLVSLSVDRSRDGGGYRDVDDVVSDRALYAIMLEDALRELQRVRTRYEHVAALKPVWSAVGKVARTTKAKGKRKGGESRATA